MDLIPILKSLGDKYTVKRDVNFEKLGVTVGLQTLTAVEEVKVLESCKDFEGSQYLQTLKRNSLAYAIKSVNGTMLEDEIPVTDDGKKVSRFMFLCGYLDDWPSAIRDVLFEVFTDMNQELEKNVSSTAKFTRFSMSTPSFAETKPLFRRVNEPEEPVDEADALQKKVDEEINAENAKLSKSEV